MTLEGAAVGLLGKHLASWAEYFCLNFRICGIFRDNPLRCVTSCVLFIFLKERRGWLRKRFIFQSYVLEFLNAKQNKPTNQREKYRVISLMCGI